MKIFVRLFVIALISLAVTMLYTWYTSPVEVLKTGRTTAKSQHSDKIVSAPTRYVRQAGREFWQVSTPNGTWYNCRDNDCAETLRVEYVDQPFNHMQAPEPGTPSPYQRQD